MSKSECKVSLSETLKDRPLFEPQIVSMVASFIPEFEGNDEKLYGTEASFNEHHKLQPINRVSDETWVYIIKKCYKYSRTHYIKRNLDKKIMLMSDKMGYKVGQFPRTLISIASKFDIMSLEAVLTMLTEADVPYEFIYRSIYEELDSSYSRGDKAHVRVILEAIDLFEFYEPITSKRPTCTGKLIVNIMDIVLVKGCADVDATAEYLTNFKSYILRNPLKFDINIVRANIAELMIHITNPFIIDRIKSDGWI